MTPQELRIGNYVYWINNERIIMLDNVHLEMIFSLKCYDEYSPIPLTEDWLLKFGFEKHPDKNEYIHLGWGMILVKNPNTTYKVKPSFSRYGIAVVKSVHQLQNLYFALTGKELTI